MKLSSFMRVFFALILAACLLGSSQAASSAAVFNEAPMLKGMVAAGLLPPVAARLPGNPEVVTPLNGMIGAYGGMLRTATWWEEMGNVQLYMYDPPLRWKADYSGYEPGLATSVSWSPDGHTVTIAFRQDVRWSDGEPFTTADLQFWWEDLAKNSAYSRVNVPWYMRRSDGSPITVSFPSNHTMVWTSDQPIWLAPYGMAQGYWEWTRDMMKPRHYLEQFHPAYTAGKTYADLAAADRWWANTDFPTLTAWRCKKVYSSGDTLFERNPYYWKVDTAGNQLPYIDHIYVDFEPDAQIRAQNLLDGKYDASFHAVDNPLLIDEILAAQDDAGYHLLPGWMNGAGAWPGYMVNQNYTQTGNPATDSPKDQRIRLLLQNALFRRAVSVALDRQTIINQVWGGSGTPKAFTISPQSYHFSGVTGQTVYNNWSSSYVGYNKTQAMTWLDSIGMVDANGDTWRDLPGAPPVESFTLELLYNDWGGSLEVQQHAADLVKAQLAEIGINVNLLGPTEVPDIDWRTNEGHYMLRAVHVAELDLWTYPDWVFPVANRYIWPLNGRWYESGGASGWEPAVGSTAYQLQQLFNEGQTEEDPAVRQSIIWEAIQIHIDQGPFVIGVSGDQPMPVVIGDHLYNVPETGVTGPWAPASPGSQHPEQFWLDTEPAYLPLIRR